MALASYRTCQYDVLPEKNPRLTPASRAASTLSRIFHDQYSSWPTDRYALCDLNSIGSRSTSTLVAYVTSYPSASRNCSIGNSHDWKSAAPFVLSPSYGRLN